MMQANFRSLFTLGYNQYAPKGKSKTAKELWPIESIDGHKAGKQATEDIYQRNKKIIEANKNLFKN